MVEMRQLNEDERKLTTKNVVRVTEDKKYLEYSLEYTQFMLDKGLDLQMRSLRKQKEAEKKALLHELAEADVVLKVSEGQLQNGVEVKEEIKESKV